MKSHVDDEDKDRWQTTTLIQGDGSNYKNKTTIVNESGRYSLVLFSKRQAASNNRAYRVIKLIYPRRFILPGAFAYFEHRNATAREIRPF